MKCCNLIQIDNTVLLDNADLAEIYELAVLCGLNQLRLYNTTIEIIMKCFKLFLQHCLIGWQLALYILYVRLCLALYSFWFVCLKLREKVKNFQVSFMSVNCLAYVLLVCD